VKAFRAKKKFAVAYAARRSAVSRPATAAYYLATAFDEIWLQPSGDLGLNGPNRARAPSSEARSYTARRQAEFGQRHEFKTR